MHRIKVKFPDQPDKWYWRGKELTENKLMGYPFFNKGAAETAIKLLTKENPDWLKGAILTPEAWEE